jgi:signal transduction histidine kinase
MRERARLLGGRCSVTSHAGKGTQIDVWLPCPEMTG